MYIQKIKIKNYRNYDCFKMSFQDGLNVIIGGNNSGKTNLLRAIELLRNPDTITLHDFNKNNLLKFNSLYKESAPTIEFEYTVKHEISEDDTDDESIIKLLYFLGLDEITSQKKEQNTYNLTANINMKYILNEKYLERFKEEVSEISEYQMFVDLLDKYLKYYNWNFTNGVSGLEVDKKDVTDIFEIDFIDAERDTDRVYKETRKAINDFLKNEDNSNIAKDIEQELSESLQSKLGEVTSSIDSVIEQEKNEIGLKKGNIAITQDLRSNVSIPDAYVLNVRDTQSNFDLPLSHNGVGYNNLINMYMLIKLKELRQVKDFQILCLEEPEAHLHPAMQYKLFSYIKEMNDQNKLNQQIFVTTHSSNITAIAGLDNMQVLQYKRGNSGEVSNGAYLNMKSQLDGENEAKNHLLKFLDVTRSDMLFADKVILVEGIAEKLLLPRFIEKSGYSYEDEHISIVEIGGKHFEHFLKIFANNALNKKVLCITDKDYKLLNPEEDSLKRINEYRSYKPAHIKKLESNFQSKQNIHWVYQNSYGRTFEDELFLFNLTNNEGAHWLLRGVLSKNLTSLLDKYGIDFDKWFKNKDEINQNSKHALQLLQLVQHSIKNHPDEEDDYKSLFFAKLFLHYVNNSKGEVALNILTDETLMESLVVPDYIGEGLKWLLK